MFVNGYFGFLITSTGGQPVPVPGAQTTGILNTYDNNGVLKNGVKIYHKMILPPPNVAVYDSSIKESISVAGIVTINNIFMGAIYDFWRGRSGKVRMRIPTTGTFYILSPILGDDSADTCIT